MKRMQFYQRFSKQILLLICLLGVPFPFLSGEISTYRLHNEIAREEFLLERIERELQRLKEISVHRRMIRQYDQAGDYESIINHFNIRADQLENSYRENDREAITLKHQEIRYIYKDIDVVRDLYLFYNALYDFYQRNIHQAAEKLTEVINNYPQSKRIRPAVSLLRTIYIVTGKNREYIDLHEKFEQFASFESIYLKGQAHYNLREYDKAVQHFTALSNDPEFGFRSQIMIGIIEFANYNTTKAYDHFQQLMQAYGPTEPYYDFLILTLARLTGQNSYFLESLDYYGSYIDLNRKRIDDELAYEIALVNKAAGYFETALFYLNRIVEMPEKSPLYDDSIALIAAIQVHTIGYNSSIDLINDILLANSAYGEMLVMEKSFLTRVRNGVEDYIFSNRQGLGITDQESTSERKQLDYLFRRYEEIRNWEADSKISSLDESEQEFTAALNSEYISLLELITRTDDLAAKVSELPNDRRVELITSWMSDLDSLRVDLLSTQYLVNLMLSTLPEDKDPDLDHRLYSRFILDPETINIITEYTPLAKDFAVSIIHLENRLYEDRDSLSEKERDTIEDRLAILKLQAEKEFGTINEEIDFISTVVDELNSLAKLRNTMSAIRVQVAASFHEKVANRIRRVNRNRFQESNFAYDYSIELMSKTQLDLKRTNEKYEYALLDVLFQENIRRDQEYRLRREMSEENSELEYKK